MYDGILQYKDPYLHVNLDGTFDVWILCNQLVGSWYFSPPSLLRALCHPEYAVVSIQLIKQ